jgi:hypothetical protein
MYPYPSIIKKLKIKYLPKTPPNKPVVVLTTFS